MEELLLTSLAAAVRFCHGHLDYRCHVDSVIDSVGERRGPSYAASVLWR